MNKIGLCMKQNRISGRIIKGIGGFYYVRPDGSTSLLECKARGVFRHQKIKPMVGDFVEVVENDSDELAIDKIKPRKNEFVRPPINALLLIRRTTLPCRKLKAK